ncbi:SAM-dependent methyltransferase, partial [Klebsiella pneumoniae]
MSAQPYFDDLHEQEDPFGYRSRWYEERKRALLLASLSQRQFARGWELGCSNGVLTEALAARCERLLATDISPRAAFQARRN